MGTEKLLELTDSDWSFHRVRGGWTICHGDHPDRHVTDENFKAELLTALGETGGGH